MIIAVSGLSGSGNTTVCGLVAKELNLRLINYTFRNLAQELGIDLEELHLRRKIDGGIDCLLDKRQLERVGKEGNAIIGSRLAIWLADANLRVWLEAPLNVRAERIAKREGGEARKALEETRKRDLENAEQYKKLYGIDISDHGFADVTIDAGKYSAEEIAKKIAGESKKDKYKNIKKSNFGDSIRKSIKANLEKLKC